MNFKIFATLILVSIDINAAFFFGLNDSRSAIETYFLNTDDNKYTSKLYSSNYDCNFMKKRGGNCIIIDGEIENTTDPNMKYDSMSSESEKMFKRMTSDYFKFEEKLDETLKRFLQFYIKEKLFKSHFLVDDEQSFVIEPIKIFLNSEGGNVDESILIGKLIRKYNLITSIPQDSQCLSSCFLIFMSGINRVVSEEIFQDLERNRNRITREWTPIGIHSPYFDRKKFADLPAQTASKIYRDKISEVENYLNEMGSPELLIRVLKNTPSDKMYYLTYEEFITSNVENDISINGFYWDPVYYDRYLGSDMDMISYILKEQVDAIIEDYLDKIDPYYKTLHNHLITIYGLEYWKIPLKSIQQNDDLSKETCKEIIIHSGVNPKTCVKHIDIYEYSKIRKDYDVEL